MVGVLISAVGFLTAALRCRTPEVDFPKMALEGPLALETLLAAVSFLKEEAELTVPDVGFLFIATSRLAVFLKRSAGGSMAPFSYF